MARDSKGDLKLCTEAKSVDRSMPTSASLVARLSDKYASSTASLKDIAGNMILCPVIPAMMLCEMLR